MVASTDVQVFSRKLQQKFLQLDKQLQRNKTWYFPRIHKLRELCKLWNWKDKQHSRSGCCFNFSWRIFSFDAVFATLMYTRLRSFWTVGDLNPWEVYWKVIACVFSFRIKAFSIVCSIAVCIEVCSHSISVENLATVIEFRVTKLWRFAQTLKLTLKCKNDHFLKLNRID